MKLKLIYLVVAVLIAAIAATVYVQVQAARLWRERQAVEAALDPVLRKLALSDEALYADSDTLERLSRARDVMRQMKRASDPARREPLEGEVTDLFSEAGSDNPRVEAAAACRKIRDWFEDPTDRIGAYLRAHPDLANQRLRPALFRLLDACMDDEDLNYDICSALFAMGDRSPRFGDALMRLAQKVVHDPGKTYDKMLEALGRELPGDAFQPAGPCPDYTDAVPRATSQKVPLPPGALYMLYRDDEVVVVPEILDGDERRLYVRHQISKGPDATGGKLLVWDLPSRRLLPSPLPPDVDVPHAAVSIERGIIATAEYRPEPKPQPLATGPSTAPGLGTTAPDLQPMLTAAPTGEARHRLWIRLWDLQGKSLGQLRGPLQEPGQAYNPAADAGRLSLSSEGVLTWTLDDSSGFYRWNVVDRELYSAGPVEETCQDSERLRALSPGGEFLATLSGNELTIWRTTNLYSNARDVNTRAPFDVRPFRKAYHPHNYDQPDCLGWLDDRFMVVGPWVVPWVILFDIDTCRPVGCLSEIHSPIARFYHVGSALFTVHWNGDIIAWDTDAIAKWCAARVKAPSSRPANSWGAGQ